MVRRGSEKELPYLVDVEEEDGEVEEDDNEERQDEDDGQRGENPQQVFHHTQVVLHVSQATPLLQRVEHTHLPERQESRHVTHSLRLCPGNVEWRAGRAINNHRTTCKTEEESNYTAWQREGPSANQEEEEEVEGVQ